MEKPESAKFGHAAVAYEHPSRHHGERCSQSSVMSGRQWVKMPDLAETEEQDTDQGEAEPERANSVPFGLAG